MSNSLEPQPQRRLVSNTIKWVRMLDETAHAVSRFPADLTDLYKEFDFSNLNRDELRQVRSAVFGTAVNAHMIAICLRQIDAHAKQLQSKAPSFWRGSVAQKGSQFIARFGSAEIRDMRNVLEHGAQYIVGDGDKPELITDPEADWPSVLVVNGRVERIAVFGRTYEVKAIILAAIDFASMP